MKNTLKKIIIIFPSLISKQFFESDELLQLYKPEFF